MEKPKIIVKDLWKSYDKLEVLRGLNLEVLEGETLVILGRSGVGKSVLLRQILGIENPDKGYIEIDNSRITELNQQQRYEIVKNMGMLFQGAALFDSMTVGENTAFYLKQHGQLTPKEVKTRIDEALKLVGLEGTENKMPSDLSGGMRKRAAIARLVIYRPQIVLYDEPTTGLDPITAQNINELINKTREELKSTSVVVTHDIHSAIEVGDRLAFHHEGRILHIAPKDEFLKIDDPLLHTFFKDAIVTQKQLDM